MVDRVFPLTFALGCRIIYEDRTFTAGEVGKVKGLTRLATIFLVSACLLTFFGGCSGDWFGNEESWWHLDRSTATNIDPERGFYQFGPEPGHGGFFMIEKDGKKYIHYASDGWSYYDFEIVNGAFFFAWGEIWDDSSAGVYPTDAFAISGHFASARKASGIIKTDHYGQPREQEFFDAQWVSY